MATCNRIVPAMSYFYHKGIRLRHCICQHVIAQRVFLQTRYQFLDIKYFSTGSDDELHKKAKKLPAEESSDTSSGTSSSSDSSDSDDEKEVVRPTKEKSAKQLAALDKLNSLLLSMSIDKTDETPKSISLDLAKPIKTFERRKIAEKQKQNLKIEGQDKESEFDTVLVKAVKEVADELGGNAIKTESELLQKLRQHAAQTEASKMGKGNLDNLIVGMKIERLKKSPRVGYSDVSATQQVGTETEGLESGQPRMAKASMPRMSKIHAKINLFGSGSLKIFSKSALESGEKKEFPELKIWNFLEKKALRQLIIHPPANGFEEAILWTEQNKLWKFPIDNEQGLEEEAKVGFHEHVFLEPLLEEGFPKKGPVRHFMELVVTGLSQNPYLSVKEKHDHVDWFRKYFKEKDQVLSTLGIS